MSDAADQDFGTLVAWGAARLTAATIAAPTREARLLLAHATGQRMETIMAWPERTATAEQAARYRQFVDRRAAHTPFSRITGVREFWSLPFTLAPDTLDPRADTETLIEAVLARIDDRQAPLRIVDFGTGSGCILLSLLHELPGATGLGIDLSPGAVAASRHNAAQLGLDTRAQFQCGDWDAGLCGPFDLVVSNPPYIETAALASLAPNVRDHDPILALDGGADGLAPYRRLVPAAARLLTAGGLVAVEVGLGQADAVAQMLAQHRFAAIATVPDLAGIQRVVLARHTRQECINSTARNAPI